MPRKSDKIAIDNEELDRRVKLTAEDKEEIIALYKNGKGGLSQRGLARRYGVSRSLIQIIVNPERTRQVKETFKKNQKDGRYYDREKHTEQMRQHRDYKKELYKVGLIGGNEDVSSI